MMGQNGYYDGQQEQYQSPDGNNQLLVIGVIGMYQNEEDMYGDEMDGEEDRNDGLNALVGASQFQHFIMLCALEPAVGDWHQQGHRPGSPQSDH